MRKYALPSPKELRKILSYDPSTGCMTWLPREGEDRITKSWNKRYSGKPALAYIGSVGYRRGNLLGHSFNAHRVAWALITGVWPEHEIDHINGIRSDNRQCNLRHVSRQTNAKNLKARIKRSQLPAGVRKFPNRTKPYSAQVQCDGKIIYLGYFPTAEAASCAYLLEISKRGFSERHGKPTVEIV